MGCTHSVFHTALDHSLDDIIETKEEQHISNLLLNEVIEYKNIEVLYNLVDDHMLDQIQLDKGLYQSIYLFKDSKRLIQLIEKFIQRGANIYKYYEILMYLLKNKSRNIYIAIGFPNILGTEIDLITLLNKHLNTKLKSIVLEYYYDDILKQDIFLTRVRDYDCGYIYLQKNIQKNTQNKMV